MPTPQELEQLNQFYQAYPETLSNEDVDSIQQSNAIAGVPFKRNYEASEFNFVNTIKNLLGGFVQGFTTIDTGVEQKNTWDSIANSVGNLFGFMGIIPGAGTALSLVSKGLGASFKGAKLLQVASKVTEMKSIPMLMADFTMKKMGEWGGKEVALTAERMLASKTVLGKKILDVAEGALHLGLASGFGAAPIYDWTTSIDERFQAMKHGALAGGVFRTMGNFIPNSNVRDPQDGIIQQLYKSFGRDAGATTRMLSTAMFMGLPSTIKDDPIELQVKSYLEGLLFGVGESSINEKNVIRFSQKAPQEYLKGADVYSNMREVLLLDPEKLPGWSKDNPMADGFYLTETEQKIMNEQVDLLHARRKLNYDKKDVRSQLNLDLSGTEIHTESSVALHQSIADAISNKRMESVDKMNELIAKHRDGVIGKSLYENDYKQLMREYQELNSILYDAQVDVLTEKNKEKLYKENPDYASNMIEFDVMARKEATKEISNRLHADIAVVKAENYVADAKTNVKQIGDNIDEIQAVNYRYIASQEKRVPSPILNPITEVAKNTLPEGYNGEALLKRKYEIVEILGDLIDKHSKLKKSQKGMSGITFDEVATEINKKFPEAKVSKENPTYAPLVNILTTMEQFEPVKTGFYDTASGMVYEYANGEKDAQGNPVTLFKSKYNFLYNNLKAINPESDPIEIRTTRVTETDPETGIQTVTDEDLYVKGFNFGKAVNDMHKQGYALLFGVKDSPNLVFDKYLDGASTPEKAQEYLDAVAKKLNRSKKKLKEFQEGIADGYEIAKKENPKLTKGMYSQKLVNNMIVREQLEGKPIEHILKADFGKTGFLGSATKFVKRTSLMINGFPIYMRKDFKDLLPDGKMKGVLTDAVEDVFNKKGEDISLVETRFIDGKWQKVKIATHQDGAIILRGDIFDRFAQAMGMEVHVGGLKGTQTGTTEYGMMLGKYLYHRATAEYDKEMQRLGLHYIHNTTTAKAYGDTPVYKRTWKDGKLTITDKSGNDIFAREIARETQKTPAQQRVPETSKKSKLADWIQEGMRREGKEPDRMFNDFDLGNQSVVDAIKNDPTLSELQKKYVLATGNKPKSDEDRKSTRLNSSH